MRKILEAFQAAEQQNESRRVKNEEDKLRLELIKSNTKLKVESLSRLNQK